MLLWLACFGVDVEPGGRPGGPVPDSETGSPNDSPSDRAVDSAVDTAVGGCGASGSPGTAVAPLLPASSLEGAAEPAEPLDGQAFAEPEGADDPLHAFAGRLRFQATTESRTVHEADPWFTRDYTHAPLPAFDVELVTCGRDVLPTTRGRVQADDQDIWDLFVGPGRTWSTPHDAGLTRVALPFSLGFKWINCVFNGLLTFVHDGASVSQVRWQITQETCHLLKLDAWGQAEATVVAGVDDAVEAAAIDAWQAELAARPEVRSFEQLAVDHPGVDLDAFDLGLTLADLSARGLLVDDVLYLDRCRTRTGEDPFCQNLVLPSFSLAKTTYTGLGLAAMAQEFEPDPYAQTLGGLLGAEGTWAEVTLENVIDMATGHYLFDDQADVAVPGFYESLDLAGRLQATYALPQQVDPGEKVVYLTPNSGLAAAAMDAYLEQVGSPVTDSFDYLVDRVLRPAGLTEESFQSLRTWEAGGENNGTGFGGYGLWFTPHGIGALGAFLQRGGDGVLHPDRLADTLMQTADRGPSLSYYGYSYNNAMWGYPVAGCSDVVAPILFGVSGISVVLPPNGTVYFAFTDAQEYQVVNVLEQTAAIAPHCE